MNMTLEDGGGEGRGGGGRRELSLSTVTSLELEEDKIDTFISAAAVSHRHMVGVCASRIGRGRDTTCYDGCPVNI